MADFKDLLLKIANNAKLTPQELEDLGRFGADTQQRNAFVAGNTTPQSKLDVKFPIFPIYSEILQTAVASITVPIPGDCKHLLFMGNGRTDGVAGYLEGAMLQFNGDTDNNYMHTGEGRLNNSTTGYQNTANSSVFVGDFNTANSGAGAVGGFFAILQNINSSFWKAFSTMYGASQAAAGASLYTVINYGVWKSTDKIQSVKLITETGSNIIASSSFSVYGII